MYTYIIYKCARIYMCSQGGGIEQEKGDVVKEGKR